MKQEQILNNGRVMIILESNRVFAEISVNKVFLFIGISALTLVKVIDTEEDIPTNREESFKIGAYYWELMA
ncbi:hypothetical protein NIES4071_06320 [Calothrix sp. NIES-4071]|nr:hypothetical protein NIES4071_06320 [Calothrix sp. NIES-4071]BAZ54975.1 hypothetical protein NIES4105_06290 [Calothrix sp. NIES-4105]